MVNHRNQRERMIRDADRYELNGAAWMKRMERWMDATFPIPLEWPKIITYQNDFGLVRIFPSNLLTAGGVRPQLGETATESLRQSVRTHRSGTSPDWRPPGGTSPPVNRDLSRQPCDPRPIAACGPRSPA